MLRFSVQNVLQLETCTPATNPKMYARHDKRLGRACHNHLAVVVSPHPFSRLPFLSTLDPPPPPHTHWNETGQEGTRVRSEAWLQLCAFWMQNQQKIRTIGFSNQSIPSPFSIIIRRGRKRTRGFAARLVHNPIELIYMSGQQRENTSQQYGGKRGRSVWFPTASCTNINTVSLQKKILTKVGNVT